MLDECIKTFKRNGHKKIFAQSSKQYYLIRFVFYCSYLNSSQISIGKIEFDVLVDNKIFIVLMRVLYTMLQKKIVLLFFMAALFYLFTGNEDILNDEKKI